MLSHKFMVHKRLFLNIGMRSHFVGNGPSQNLFGDFQYGFTVAGNLPKHIKIYTALSIIDTKVILYLKNNNLNLKNKEIWCTPDMVKQANFHKIQGTWIPHYKPQYRYNSGHHAVQHLSKKFRFIELWGMDSMWSDDLTSQMDDRVIRTKRPPLNREWRPHWQAIFKQHPDVRYTIHAPQGVNKVDYGENCRYQFH